ncbi:MAG: hypothetical protein AAB381_02565 [Patescibacteria group bacterium]
MKDGEKANIAVNGEELTVWFDSYLGQPVRPGAKCFHCGKPATQLDIIEVERIDWNGVDLPLKKPFAKTVIRKLNPLLMHRVAYCDSSHCEETLAKRSYELQRVEKIFTTRSFKSPYDPEQEELRS